MISYIMRSFLQQYSTLLCLLSGISTGIYTTNGAEAVHYVLEHSQSNIVVVEDDAQLRKVLAVRDRLPHLKAAVQYRGAPRDCNQSDDFPIVSVDSGQLFYSIIFIYRCYHLYHCVVSTSYFAAYGN